MLRFHFIQNIFFFGLTISLSLLINISCNKKVKTIKQPEILSESCGFDLSKLTFLEDTKKLISKSLDTINFDFKNGKYDVYMYPDKKHREKLRGIKKFTYLRDVRYFLETLEFDSIAQFDKTFFDKIYLETNSKFQIQSCFGYTKFFDKEKLDSTLLKLYQKYGKTTNMKETEKLRGLQEVLIVYGDGTREIKYEKPDINYEKYLYEYDIGYSRSYYEWKLSDRILQLEISQGFETTFANEQLIRRKYHLVQYLIIKKEEYVTIENALIQKSKENDYPVRMAKPYNIDALNFYDHSDIYSQKVKEQDLK